MQYDYKEVDFAKYCKTCENFDKEEPKNLYSHKPVEYVEDPKRVKMLKKIKMLKKMEGNN